LSFLSSFVQLSKDVDHKHVQGRSFGIVIMSYDIATALGEQLKKVRAPYTRSKKRQAGGRARRERTCYCPLPLLTGAFVPAVLQAKYRCVIIDESHALKNHKSKRAKTILPVIRAAKRAILLSGTRKGTNNHAMQQASRRNGSY
jgi:hypothetical protein